MQKVLVTGASGFIGSWVTKKLINKYNVVATVTPFRNNKRLDGIDKNLIVEKIDLADSKKVKKIIKKHKPFAILHLASHGVYGYQQGDEDRIIFDNLRMSQNLLESSVEFGVQKFINTGSVFEYGTKKGNAKENEVDITDIINKYSVVKMATTALASFYKNKLKVLTIRPFTAYGPYDDSSRFISSVVIKALKNEEIVVVKNVLRDFVYVEDMADAYVKSLESKFISGDVINVGSGYGTTLTAAAKEILKVTNSKSKIVYGSSKYGSNESMCWADISKAKKVLKWSPKYSLNEGLVKAVDFAKK